MPIPPIYDPMTVAEAIAAALEHPRRDIVVGGAGKLFEIGERLSPRLIDAYLGRGRGVQQQLTREPDDRRDNIFAPLDGRGETHGRWSAESRPTSGYTRLFELHPGRAAALTAATVGATILALRGRPGRWAARVWR